MSEIERSSHFYLRRWIHKIEIKQVLDTKTFELEHNACKVGTLDFRNGVHKHFSTISFFGIQAVSNTMTAT